MTKKRSTGTKLAEGAARVVGSWWFLVAQSVVLISWVILNVTVLHLDRWPFIFMNLILSLQAAYTAPLLLIAQNRQDEADRRVIKTSLQLNQEMTEMLEKVHAHLCAQDDLLELIEHKLNKRSNN